MIVWGIWKVPRGLNQRRDQVQKEEITTFSNNRILHRIAHTVFDGKVDDFFQSEGASLKHFLKTYDVIILDDFLDLLEPLFFVIVFVCLDGWWSEKHIECE